MPAALFGAAFLLAGAIGCGPGEETTSASSSGTVAQCTLGFLGDPAREPELELISLRADYSSTSIADGSSVALMFPPQGGRVIFAGVRATNVDACEVTLGGSLRDPQNDKICFDERTVNLEPSGDGWGASVDSDISTFSNIPVCPNQWSASNAFESEYDLTVKLRDKGDRVIEKTVRVVPFCAEPENEEQCRCICKQGYVLGETCEPSASTASTASGAAMVDVAARRAPAP